MIYFDNNKQAYAFEIENPVCTIPDEQWKQYAGTDKWDIIDGVFTDITDTPEYIEEKLQKAKETKYKEANDKAREYLDGEALFEFEEGKHIEATDGNIGKFTAYALAYVTGQLQPTDTVVWNTKEDETVELNQEQVSLILTGLGQVQAYVWAVQYNVYVEAIKEATTVEEVEAIEIVYTSDLQEESVENEISTDN